MKKSASGSRRRASRPGPSPAALLGLFAAGLAMVPGCVALLRALRRIEEAHDGPPVEPFGLSAPLTAFLAGATAFAAVYVFRRIPTKWYVATHELTHAAVALLFGSRVSRLRIGEEHGSVDVARSNAVVLLAPYFLPLPAAALLLAWLPAFWFLPLPGWAPAVFAAAFGAAWGFHFCFTLNALLQHQTDLDRYGFFFSAVFLFFMNLLFLFAAAVALVPSGARPFSALLEMFAETYLRFRAF